MESFGVDILELYFIQFLYYAPRSNETAYFLIFLNLVLYSKDIYHDEATAFFEYLLKCAFPCDLLGMWICYIYLWYTNARQTAKLLWCFLDSVLKAEFRKRIKTNEHHHWYYIIKSNKSSRWLSNFFSPFRILHFNIQLNKFQDC